MRQLIWIYSVYKFIFIFDALWVELGDNCTLNCHFGEVNHQFYGRKFCFTSVRLQSHKMQYVTIPPEMTI